MGAQSIYPTERLFGAAFSILQRLSDSAQGTGIRHWIVLRANLHSQNVRPLVEANRSQRARLGRIGGTEVFAVRDDRWLRKKCWGVNVATAVGDAPADWSHARSQGNAAQSTGGIDACLRAIPS